MKQYEKPMVELNLELAEGVYAASGTAEDGNQETGGVQNPVIPPVGDPNKPHDNGNHYGNDKDNNGNNGNHNGNGYGYDNGNHNGSSGGNSNGNHYGAGDF